MWRLVLDLIKETQGPDTSWATHCSQQTINRTQGSHRVYKTNEPILFIQLPSKIEKVPRVKARALPLVQPERGAAWWAAARWAASVGPEPCPGDKQAQVSILLLSTALTCQTLLGIHFSLELINNELHF